MTKSKYSPLGKVMNSETDIAKEQYQKSDDKIIKIEKSTLGKYIKSNRIRDANNSIYKYYGDIEKYNHLSFKSKYFFLGEFFND